MLTFQAIGSSQGLYDIDNITTIEITFDDNDWEQNLEDLFIAGFNDRLLGIVEINGEAFDSVGVRYRSNSTFDPTQTKKSLNIKLDHVKAQDFQGFESIKLANGAKDPSFVRDVLSFEVARKYMKAPRANYARVFVNGSYHGLYANIESVNSKFVSENFLSDNDNPRFECSPSYNLEPPVPPFGCEQGLGGSLEYLGDGIICYFDHYEISSTTGWEELKAAATTLENNPELARSVIDVDRFLWISAFNSLMCNLDSYLGAIAENYFIYQQDNGAFAPTMDDLNESIGRYPWLESPLVGGMPLTLAEFINLDPYWGQDDDRKPVLKTIFNNPVWKKMYVAHFRTMLEENFDNGWLANRASELQALINNDVVNDPNAIYSASDFTLNLENTVTDAFNGESAFGILELMNDRADYLKNLPDFLATRPTIGNNAHDPASPPPSSDVTVTAEVGNADLVLLGHRGSLKDLFILTEMFDDGAHGDGAAGDGVYGASVQIGITGLQYYVYAENAGAGVFSPAHAELEFHNIGVGGDVVINEVLVDNEETQADPSGQFDDWLELYNNTDAQIDLSGWYLSDKEDELDRWQFPNGTMIDANGYLIVWVDDDEMQPGLHTSFSLNNAGEAILLIAPDFTVIDKLIFGQQSDDISLARCPNGVGAFEFATPSFDSNNDATCMLPTEEVLQDLGLEIYPNPASHALFIEVDYAATLKVEIFNTIGQQFYYGEMNGQTEIDVSDLLAGLYFVKIGENVVEKVMISK